MTSLGIPPGAVTVSITSISFACGQTRNCNPQRIAPENLVDCQDLIANGWYANFAVDVSCVLRLPPPAFIAKSLVFPAVLMDDHPKT